MNKKFNAWVKKYGGPSQLARVLGVSDHAVRIWTRGDGRPKAVTMRDIVRLSDGEITYTDLIYIGLKKKAGARK